MNKPGSLNRPIHPTLAGKWGMAPPKESKGLSATNWVCSACMFFPHHLNPCAYLLNAIRLCRGLSAQRGVQTKRGCAEERGGTGSGRVPKTCWIVMLSYVSRAGWLSGVFLGKQPSASGVGRTQPLFRERRETMPGVKIGS